MHFLFNFCGLYLFNRGIEREDLLNDDCHISVGIAVGNEANSIDELNIISETRMYEDKEQYYKSEENERRKRNIDDKLARIVNDKENQDAFLKVIQSHYLGVYLVNLDTDNTRCIFKPEYFEFILKKHNYNFGKSIKEYAENYIVREDLTDFLNLLNYDFSKIVEIC